jgi:excisionase family DNA binding protein
MEVTMKKSHDIIHLSYGVQESAAALGVSPRTLHDYIKDGRIKHFRIGTRVLIPIEGLRQFIALRTQKGVIQNSRSLCEE